jgi:outer membrane protein TolC
MYAWIAAIGLAASVEPVHLASLILEARAKNLVVHAAMMRARTASLAVKPAKTLDDPMVMLQLWNAPVDLATIPLMVQLTQAIPLGGKIDARAKAAEAEAAAARASAQVQARDVEAAVVKAYFELFVAEQTLVVNAESQRILEALREVALARAAGGLGEQSEALRAQTELVALEGENEEAKAQRRTADVQLLALLNREPGTTIGSPGFPGFLPALPTEEQLREQALHNRPELAVANALLAAAQAQAQLADAAAAPDIAPMVGFMRNFRGVGERNFFFLGVQGTLPIFFESKINPRREAAAAQTQGLQDLLQAQRNEITAEVAQSYARVKAQQRAIEIHHRLIPLAKETVASALASYSTGRTGFSMVLDSERDLQMHELKLTKHLATYELHAAELERAVSADLGVAGAAESGDRNSHHDTQWELAAPPKGEAP